MVKTSIYSLKSVMFPACLHWSIAGRLGRAADVLEDAASELQAVVTVVEATNQPMSRRDALKGHMDTIFKYAQDKSAFKPSMVPRVRLSAVAIPAACTNLGCLYRSLVH